MGMFDTIRCEYPLRDKQFQKESFQTKSLECLLDEYKITKRGRLVLVGSGRRNKSDQIVDTEHHGDIRFYTSVGERDDGSYEWVEYEARFTEGTVKWIKRVDEE